MKLWRHVSCYMPSEWLCLNLTKMIIGSAVLFLTTRLVPRQTVASSSTTALPIVTTSTTTTVVPECTMNCPEGFECFKPEGLGNPTCVRCNPLGTTTADLRYKNWYGNSTCEACETCPDGTVPLMQCSNDFPTTCGIVSDSHCAPGYTVPDPMSLSTKWQFACLLDPMTPCPPQKSLSYVGRDFFNPLRTFTRQSTDLEDGNSMPVSSDNGFDLGTYYVTFYVPRFSNRMRMECVPSTSTPSLVPLPTKSPSKSSKSRADFRRQRNNFEASNYVFISLSALVVLSFGTMYACHLRRKFKKPRDTSIPLLSTQSPPLYTEKVAL